MIRYPKKNVNDIDIAGYNFSDLTRFYHEQQEGTRKNEGRITTIPVQAGLPTTSLNRKNLNSRFQNVTILPYSFQFH